MNTNSLLALRSRKKKKKVTFYVKIFIINISSIFLDALLFFLLLFFNFIKEVFNIYEIVI